MNNWRLIINEPFSGAMNMAIDEAILRGVNRRLVPPTIRLYRWSAPTITLGYFQSLKKEIDFEACAKNKIEVVRRLTGGRAVLHHRELTYSVIAPENHPKVTGSVLNSYLAISRGLIEGLKELGIQAELTEGKKGTQQHHSSACFDAPSWYELVVDGKKLLGSAQCRKEGVILQHGSLPIDLDADLLFSVLAFPNEELRVRAKTYLLNKATCLQQELSYQPQFEELSVSFSKGFKQGLEINLKPESLTPEELTWANELCEGKYSQKEWNAKK